jgi:hypothetical protein
MNLLYKRVDNTETVNKLKIEIAEYTKWFDLYKSPHGKFLMEFLNKAMEETMLAPDVDIDFKSVRSKYQTLKALRDKLIKSSEEVDWRQKDIGKLEKL